MTPPLACPRQSGPDADSCCESGRLLLSPCNLVQVPRDCLHGFSGVPSFIRPLSAWTAAGHEAFTGSPSFLRVWIAVLVDHGGVRVLKLLPAGADAPQAPPPSLGPRLSPV